METAIGYLSIKQTSEKGNISVRWVDVLCKAGRWSYGDWIVLGNSKGCRKAC